MVKVKERLLFVCVFHQTNDEMKLFLASMVVLAAVTATAAEGPVVLTNSNFEAEVKESGKAAFVKFLAPW